MHSCKPKLNILWVTDNIWYMAKGHPKVGWAPIGFAVAAPCNLVQTFLRASFWVSFEGGPLSVLQQWQPHDPLDTTLVIPNFV